MNNLSIQPVRGLHFPVVLAVRCERMDTQLSMNGTTVRKQKRVRALD